MNFDGFHVTQVEESSAVLRKQTSPISVSKTLLSLDDVTSIQWVGQCCHLAPPILKSCHVFFNNFHVSTCFHSWEKN
jgi:hypothetical protein